MSRTIHVVDDDEQVRESLGLLLETSGYVVEAHLSGDAFIAAETPLDDALVVLDIRMPGRDGLETLDYLREVSTTVPVIMISGHGDIPLAVKAMQMGANDFVEKPFVARRILTTIDKLNEQPLEAAAPEGPDPLEPLTAREREVALALCEGKPNKIVAHELGCSVRTVETHRARLMSKLGIRSLADLVKLTLSR